MVQEIIRDRSAYIGRNGLLRWVVLSVLLMAIAVPLAAACGGGGGGEEDAGSDETSTATSGPTEPGGGDDDDGGGEPSEDAVERYGYGPSDDGSVTYQPDVVLIEGGPDAIRAASSDGLTWTIDGNADGAGELEPGLIMFAASQAVGRVVEIEPAGDDLAVTLAPVELTDVIRDGQITYDASVDLEAMAFQVIPDAIGVSDDLSEEGDGETPEADETSFHIGETSSEDALVLSVPPIQLGNTAQPATDLPPPTSGSTAKTKVGDWDLTAYKAAGSVGLKADHFLASGTGLKFGLDVYVTFENLHILADVPIANGEVGQSHFRVDGLTGLGMEIAAGASEGLSDNRKIRVELPIELSQQVIIGGFPGTLKQRFKFLVETAFTAKNGNLSAGGLWRLDGPLGFDGQTLETPTWTTEKSILDSLSGVSIGVNGVVAAAEFRFSLQMGLPVAGAGPYASIIASVGLTNGSSIGLVQCRSASLTLVVHGGVGISLSSWVNKALEKALGVKVPAEKELLKKEIANVAETIPNVPLCVG